MKKHNKLSNFKGLFEHAITVSEIAEYFIAFDGEKDAAECFSFMQKKHFDIIGVQKEGRIIGYAENVKSDGILRDYLQEFCDDYIIPYNTPLSNALSHLSKSDYGFVSAFGHVVGIFTKADIHKPSVRFWLFGLVSILEINMQAIIKQGYSGDSWKGKLKEKRLKKVQELYEDLKGRKEEIDELSCCQFCDKRTLIEANRKILDVIGKSKNEFNEFAKKVEEQRNDIAHPAKMDVSGFSQIFELAGEIEGMIAKIESVTSDGRG